MPIPTYDVLMLPVLRICADKLWVMRDLVARLADDLGLSRPEREQMIPSGTMTVITSRVHWAKTYLKQAGLVEQPKRAHVQISALGREVLARNPAKIDAALLQEFDKFRDFLSRTKSENVSLAPTAVVPAVSVPGTIAAETASTPEEQIASAYLTLHESLRDALLARVLEGNPTFFEKLIVDLLLAMGDSVAKFRSV